MAIGSNSYGTSAGVAALTPRYAGTGGDFSETTRPTKAQVETLVDQVSSILNTILSKEGFSIPISQADVKLMLAFFVEEEVASIAEGINGSGRFGPTTKAPNKSRFTMILQDVTEFVSVNATGIEGLGVPRESPVVQTIGYRDTDENGDATFPLFQRDAFGQDGFFQDWDTSS